MDQTLRFTQFTMTISRLNKLIQKLKTHGMQQFGLKGVDTLCLYQLAAQPEGMTFSALAESCQLDPALVSRTLRNLVQAGMVAKSGPPGKYHAQYTLTPQAQDAMPEITRIIHNVQERADQNISPADLAVFYTVLETLTHNFSAIADDPTLLCSHGRSGGTS